CKKLILGVVPPRLDAQLTEEAKQAKRWRRGANFGRCSVVDRLPPRSRLKPQAGRNRRAYESVAGPRHDVSEGQRGSCKIVVTAQNPKPLPQGRRCARAKPDVLG